MKEDETAKIMNMERLVQISLLLNDISDSLPGRNEATEQAIMDILNGLDTLSHNL